MARHLSHPVSSTLPRLALLALFSATAAHAEAEPPSEPSCAPEQRVLVVDGETQDRCTSLFGTAADRARFREWRESYLDVVDTEGPALDIVHSVSALQPPEPAQPAGLKLRELKRARVEERCASGDETGSAEEPSEADEWLAVFELDESLAPHCESATVLLRVDDALGAEGRILWMSERGVLALLDDRLVWLPNGDTETPQFRMTWRSSFLVTSVSSSSGASSGSKATKTKKARPKRTRARKRR